MHDNLINEIAQVLVENSFAVAKLNQAQKIFFGVEVVFDSVKEPRQFGADFRRKNFFKRGDFGGALASFDQPNFRREVFVEIFKAEINPIPNS